MIRSAILFVFLFCATNFFVSAQKTADVNVESLINSMTIEEKVGQMTQIDLGVIANGEICNLQNPQSINSEKLKIAISQYHVGSILNVGCASGTISLSNWHNIISTIQNENTKLDRNKIPIIYGIDAIHGANYTMVQTLFPQQIAMAASWNPALVEKGFAITAYETRASGLPWNFSPVLDIGRQPLWSRFFETFGEDVCLAKSMTTAAINGLQGNNINNPYKVAACMKHFLGYSMPLSGKDRTPAWISDRELREYFLPTFEQAIKSGAKTVMINSGEINGTPVHVNYDILTKLLREELGFKGVAVTDWEDIYKLVNLHRVAENKKEAVRMAIMAGIDMSMTPNDFEFTKLLIELVKEGTVPEARINISVRRILELKKELGLFSQTQFTQNNYPLFGSKQHAEVSYELAAECITLLKNKNNLLPLKNEKQNILVCGPAAQSLNLLNGAWTHTWQGVDTKYNTANKLTILDAIKINAGNATIQYAMGSSLDSVMDLNDCFAKAKNADKIIVCLGELPCTELPGNIDDLSLPLAQQILVNKLKEAGKPIIFICCFNRPRILQAVAKYADAIVYAYLPGDEGGRAIADCLYGKINPSGKLPFTYPANVNAIVHYDHKTTEDQDVDFSANAYRPQFDFGFGMSYTKFDYSNFSVSQNTLNDNDSIVIKVEVKNSGAVNGKETVQVYYKDLFASITPAVKKLVAFKKINLNASQTTQVEFVIHKNDLSFINKDLKRVTEKGDFEIMINNEKKLINVK
nr:glycoside hydrolase family 3 C-terminal domain-containing protein [Bacteroidota bacterium]